MRLTLAAMALAVALTASCGKSGIEIKNGMETPISNVALAAGEQEAAWDRIGAGETEKCSITLPPRSTITLSFQYSGQERTETVSLPAEKDESPSAVWIGIYGDRVSLEYAY